MAYISSAVIAAAALGYQYHSGERMARMQRASLRDQRRANADAVTAASRQARENEKSIMRAQRKIDVATLVNATLANPDAPKTMLTGDGGIDPGRLKLGGMAGEVM